VSLPPALRFRVPLRILTVPELVKATPMTVEAPAVELLLKVPLFRKKGGAPPL